MSPSLKYPPVLLDRFTVGVGEFGIIHVRPANGEASYFAYKDYPEKALLHVEPTERGMRISRARDQDKMGKELFERARLLLALFKRDLELKVQNS